MKPTWQQPIPADGRLARAIRNAQLDQHNAEVLARITLETSTPDHHDETPLSLLGDELQLRGIPAIGRGVAGCIARTNPEREACRGQE